MVNRYYEIGYNNLNSYLKDKFGTKVYKVSLDAGLGCPHRVTGGCIYCDPAGSGTGASLRTLSIAEQMQKGMRHCRHKYGAEKFIAYFQAYTNTHATPEELKRLYDSALVSDDVVGLSIGTRPDCIDEQRLSLIESYTDRYEVWLEYGMQSAHDRTLELINRGHTFKELEQACIITRNRGINICLHIILGLPGEDYDDMMHTVREVVRLNPDGLKIHLFHVVKDSLVEKKYRDGDILLLERDEYVKIICDILEILPPTMVIQRLTGERPPDILIAPRWCLEKIAVLGDIRKELRARGSCQGKHYNPLS